MDYKKDIKTINNIIQQHRNDVSFDLFESDEKFSLIYKKTERIVSAMYLITDLFSDIEPLKWRMRSKGALLLSLIISLKNTGVRKTSDSSEKVQNTIAEIVSLFDVAHFSGIVSEMNFSILKTEFIRLINLITEYKDGSFRDRVIFDKNFFAVTLPQRKETVDISKGHYVDDKGQSFVQANKTETNQTKANSQTKKIVNENSLGNQYTKKTPASEGAVVQSQIDDMTRVEKESDIKKVNRRSLIINTIKKKGTVTIKDLTMVIRSCSEKTIQRELAILVERNVLKKEGERRWSTYSLIA